MGFEQAVAKVLEHEGGFVDDPADRGGMTFMGISRRWFPDEPFWEKIDALLDEGGNPNEAMDELRPDVKDFYRREFWNKYGCETLPESIKERHFDFTINADAGSSTKIIQTLGECLLPRGTWGRHRRGWPYRSCHPSSYRGTGQSRRGYARDSTDCVPLSAGRPLPRYLQVRSQSNPIHSRLATQSS